MPPPWRRPRRRASDLSPWPIARKDAAASFLFARPRPRLLRHLLLAQFFERLAVDAQRRRRTGLEALQADLNAAAVAVAVFAAVDAADRFVDLLDKLAFPVTVAQLERNVGFLAGPVVGIGEDGRFVLHGMHRPFDVAEQFLLERLEDLSEMRQLFGAHVFLTLFRD